MRVIISFSLLLLFVACSGSPGTDASLISESSTGAHRVTLLELEGGMDRNFEIWLEQKADGFKTNIFRFPDEGRPIGTERIIWSGDHSQFVLVGRHFMVEDRSSLPIEALYLLYDIPTGKLWCNASQTTGTRFTQTNFNTLSWSFGNYENDVFRRREGKKN
jgi:hypothetical protein